MSEVRYFGERQRIVFVNLLGESVEVLAGAGGAPTITDGYAKWLRIPRPQRNAVTILEGYEPTTLSVPITFSSTMIAGIAESGFRRTAEHKEATQTDMGIWQSDQIPGYEVEKQAAAFLKGGTSFGAGGAIAKAREGKTPGEIAKEVEVSQPPPSFYEKHLPEAEAWLAARGGVGDEGSAGESTGESGESRVGLLHRGSKENPTESSFECITKLAQEVDWYFFTKNDRGYYMSGVDLIRQEPVLYVDVPKNIVRYADGTQAYGALTTRSEKKRNRSASPHQPAVPHLPQPLHLLRLAPESHASSKPPRRR